MYSQNSQVMLTVEQNSGVLQCFTGEKKKKVDTPTMNLNPNSGTDTNIWSA